MPWLSVCGVGVGESGNFKNSLLLALKDQNLMLSL